MSVYTLEAGRVIARDGEHVAQILAPIRRPDFKSPAHANILAETDALAHRIVALLNKAAGQ